MKAGIRLATWVAAICCSTAAGAAGLVPVPPVPGSIANSTVASGINDEGVINGSYVGADQSLHGFIGWPDGSYAATFDVAPGGTAARGINNQGYITGYYHADNCDIVTTCPEFWRAPNGATIQILVPGSPAYGIAQGINQSGVFVGDYHPAGSRYPNERHGYFGANGKYLYDLTLPFPTRQTDPRALNSNEEVVGFFKVPGQNTNGFVLREGAVSVVEYPDPTATATFLEGVNDQGWICGSWYDLNGNSHAFVLNPDLTRFTDILVSGATQIQAFSINNAGEVTVDTDTLSYIYCLKGGQGRCAAMGNKIVMDAAPHVVPANSHRCINNCRFPAGTPATFDSPAGSHEPAMQISRPWSKTRPQ